ncbi:hypothetical protein [Dysgonomonas sp. 511]|uniref:hypothetical protein n=1 Tax=Dysgonomonas sp. 511 TaxID=2302930 RepID=UPI0021055033|nr:hypothetical protein [Dysgonomonas sp. 511]
MEIYFDTESFGEFSAIIWCDFPIKKCFLFFIYTLILNFETFKCAIKDTDTSAGNTSANKVVCDIISFSDMSDPIMVDIVSQKGFIIKNNANDVDAKAVLYRNGEEIDTVGTAYTYTWKLWNAAGTAVAKTYTGKLVTIAKADVIGKGVLMCEVSK